MFCVFFVTSKEVNEARRPHTCSGSCAFEEEKTPGKKAEKIRPTENAYESHSRPATTTASRRHVMKHVPRVCPHSLACMDPGFVEIGLVQLQQSVKTTNVTPTDSNTDRLIKRYSSCRYNERQLIDVTVVRRVRPRAERWCDCEGHRRCKRACRTLFCT